MPLEFDQSRSNEPFLRLPKPLQNIIITPPRKSDVESVLEYLNDPRVYNNLIGPPFPYKQEHYEFWGSMIEAGCSEGLSQYYRIMETGKGSGSPGKRTWADVFPVRSIREVNPETGEQKFIGDLEMDRQGYAYDQTKNEEERKRAKELNESYEAGDPRIEWTIGDYLAPSHHGRGIMSAAIRTMIEEYAIPFMNVHKITVSFFEHNIASRRTLEKNGFVFQWRDPKPLKMPESKGSKEIFQGVVLWERKQ